jgi:hypothetical protein
VNLKQGNDSHLLAIETRNLAKRFGAFTALGNLNNPVYRSANLLVPYPPGLA